MRPFFVVFALTGCLNQASTPTLVDPPDEPTPTPTPTPVPTPAPTMPDGSTLLVDIPTADWGWICDRVSLSQDAVDLTCPTFSIDWPARTREEDAAVCVERFEPASSWTGCEATFDDFLVATNFLPDSCAPFPAQVQAVQQCINPPPPPPPPPPPVCESIGSTLPAAGQTEVFADQIVWNMSDIDTSLEVTVVDDAGLEVDGTGAWNAWVYEWTPAVPLLANTTYTASATWCNGVSSNTFSFTTTSVGPPVPVPSLPGTTYAVDLAAPGVTFTQPSGVGGLIQSQLADLVLLVAVEDASTTTLDLRAVTGSINPIEQDLCQPTVDLPSSDFSTNPYFDAGPASLQVQFSGIEVPLEDLGFSGALTPDADALLATMQATIDTRPLVPLLAPGGNDSVVCDLLAQFGVSCVACSTGGTFCVPVEVTGIVADAQPGMTLVERTAADIAADSTCP